MPIYDFECPQCGYIQEEILTVAEITWIDKTPYNSGPMCEKCGADTFHIQSASGQFCANEDAEWIRSVREVVGKDNPLPEAQRFMKEPTRKNYKSWMKAQGIRPLETGERRRKPDFDLKRHTDKVARMRQERNRVEV